MAKITGPLMSISASGTLAQRLTFRATRAGAVVQAPPIPRTPPTIPQILERERFAQALAAWADLDTTTRNKWAALAASLSEQAHMIYTREYLLQRITAPAQPRIPATT